MNVRALYFASLADAAECQEEQVETADGDPRALYLALAQRHGFRFDMQAMRLAVNGRVASWDVQLGEGDEVAFLPPVSGG